MGLAFGRIRALKGSCRPPKVEVEVGPLAPMCFPNGQCAVARRHQCAGQNVFELKEQGRTASPEEWTQDAISATTLSKLGIALPVRMRRANVLDLRL